MTRRKLALQILLLALSAALYQCAFDLVYLRLAEIRPGDMMAAVDWSLTNFAQFLGVLILALTAWRVPLLIQAQRMLLPVAAVGLVMLTALAISDQLAPTLTYGLVMLVSVGLLSTEGLITVARCGAKQHFGRIIGFGLALGMVGEFVAIRVLGAGEPTLGVFVFTAVLIIAVPSLSRLIAQGPTGHAHESTWSICTPGAERRGELPVRTIIPALIGLTILMVSIALLGIYRPRLVVPDLIERLAFMQALLIVGAVAVGPILDVSRRIGATFTLASLSIALVSVALAGATVEQLGWLTPLSYSLGYALLGATIVFTYVAFMDVGTSKRGLLPWVVVGAALRPLVESVLIAVPGSVVANPVSGSILLAAFFAPTVLLFGTIMNRMYGMVSEAPTPVSDEERVRAFCAQHGLSLREREILELLLERKSNPQIAQILFISENTAKFHVRNILKKTGSANRTEIIDLLWNGNGHSPAAGCEVSATTQSK